MFKYLYRQYVTGTSGCDSRRYSLFLDTHYLQSKAQVGMSFVRIGRGREDKLGKGCRLLYSSREAVYARTPRNLDGEERHHAANVHYCFFF